jgi:hypothetical protein
MSCMCQLMMCHHAWTIVSANVVLPYKPMYLHACSVHACSPVWIVIFSRCIILMHPEQTTRHTAEHMCKLQSMQPRRLNTLATTTTDADTYRWWHNCDRRSCRLVGDARHRRQHGCAVLEGARLVGGYPELHQLLIAWPNWLIPCAGGTLVGVLHTVCDTNSSSSSNSSESCEWSVGVAGALAHSMCRRRAGRCSVRSPQSWNSSSSSSRSSSSEHVGASPAAREVLSAERHTKFYKVCTAASAACCYEAKHSATFKHTSPSH